MNITSPLVIATTTKALLQQNYAQFTRTGAGGMKLADLNAAGRVVDPRPLPPEPAAAEEVVPRQQVPTADFVRSSSFKVGCKLLIKIIPLNAKYAKYVKELVFEQFSLQSIAEVDAERYQLQETFEGEVLFLFGRRPRVWTMQGIVANGRKETDYANRLLQNWEDFYRGSRALEMKARAYIGYEDSVIEATLLELTAVRNAQVPGAVNATMTFVVHERIFIGQEDRESTPTITALLATAREGLEAIREPSHITAPAPTAEELGRQVAEAKAAQEAAEAATAGSYARKWTVEAAEQDYVRQYDQAVLDKARAIIDYNQALLDYQAATDSLSAQPAQERMDDAKKRIEDAEQRQSNAAANTEKLVEQKEIIAEGLSEAISEEETATQTAEVLQSTETGASRKF